MKWVNDALPSPPLPYFVCPSKAKHAAHEKKETKQRAKVSTEFQSVIV